jgi:phosphate transport system substrate-binding protein
MKRLLLGVATAAAVLTAPLGWTGEAAAAHQPNLRNLSGSVKVDGSSTVYPITEAVAEEFKKAAPRVNVTVGISGTGGGFKRFAVGETDISDASRPIKKEEHDAATANRVEYIEIPVAYDGLSIVVNPKNTWVDKLTLDEVKKIFLADTGVKTWKDVRPDWPDKPIRIFSPGTDSGTFDYFKEVVAHEKGTSIRADMSVSEDDNVLVRGVAGDEGAIGFFGVAYYLENKAKLRAVPIDAGKGPIAPTPETIENGTYAPFSRPLFIYVNKRAAQRPEVRRFVEFYLEHGPELAAEVGYVRLPSEVYDRARANLASGRTGTQFMDTSTGERISGPVTEVYK